MAKSKCVQKTTVCLSVLTRDSKYRKTCNAGFRTGLWEAHHIACNHAVEGREIGGNAEVRHYVEDCLWITDWNLNKADNLIGLPETQQFMDTDGTDPAKGFGSHQVDHNTKGGYTDECKGWLKQFVWDKWKGKRKGHDFKPKSLEADLNKCIGVFKGKLTRRAYRSGTTRTAWNNRHKPAHEYTWYYSFSIGKHPTHRSPGAKTKAMTDIFKDIS